MGFRTWSATIPGAPDVELAIPRTNPILYHVTAPPEKPNGLVFVIHGFGQDTGSEYDTKLRQHLAETYRFMAVTVEYHCYRARPHQGATVQFDPEGFLALQGLGFRCGILERVMPENTLRIIQDIGARLPERTVLKAHLRPPNGDYQNFGVVQALDHLQVMGHLLMERVAFDRRRIWLFGSSHGGYLAHLIHKFAPGTFSALIDNSGYTRANRNYLGSGVEFALPVGNLILGLSVVSAWNFETVYGPRSFGIAQDLIRQVAYRPHLAEVARSSGAKCRIRMTNSETDQISPMAHKIRQDEAYRQEGFDSSLVPFGGERSSPEFAKSSDHGDVSLKKLFDFFAPALMDSPGPGALDQENGTRLVFDCLEATYRLEYSAGEVSPKLTIQST